MYHVLCSWTFKTHLHTEYSPFDLQINSLQKHLRKLASTERKVFPLVFHPVHSQHKYPVFCVCKMGFFGKRDPPEDAIENVPVDSDTEKQMPSHEDECRNTMPDIPVVEVDPVVEKRLLRKLDWRVPMLLGFLCMFAGIVIERSV